MMGCEPLTWGAGAWAVTWGFFSPARLLELMGTRLFTANKRSSETLDAQAHNDIT